MVADDTCLRSDEEVALRAMFGRLTTQDHRLLAALACREAPPWVDRGLRLISHLGGASATVAVTLVLIALPATRHLGLVAGMANLFSHLFVQLLKRTVVRPRPTALRPELTPLAALPDHYSFPSGHSAAAMSLAVAVLFADPLSGVLCLLLALAVGSSRVYLRVHYITDVVVGQALGAAAAAVVHLSLA
jgi:undecaprenyl-diphosphatase